MIAYIKGKVVFVTQDQVVLEVNQIGYNIKISPQTASILSGKDEMVTLYTYTCVREDAFLLYGFLTRDELTLFKKLISVNGVGPKGALGILSILTPIDLQCAIIAGDSKTIAKSPGIGIKTAERVIIDLKDKVSLQDTLSGGIGQDYESMEIQEQGGKRDAMEALVALGYSSSEALKMTKPIAITPDMDSEEILKAALKNIRLL